MASAASARSARSSAAAAFAARGQQVAGRVGAVGDPGQRRPEPVVQVAAHPAALLLQRRDHPAPGGLQLLAQPGRPQRLGQRRGHQPEHRLGGGRQPQLLRGQPDGQLADGLGCRPATASPPPPPGPARPTRPAPRRPGAAAAAGHAERHPQRVQPVLRGRARAELATEPGERVHRVRAAAEQHLVDEPAHAHQHRVEPGRHPGDQQPEHAGPSARHPATRRRPARRRRPTPPASP